MDYEIIVVGAGISGAVLAERYASVLNKKVLVIEKQNHLAGNCYDFEDATGILVSKYGPHLFHTKYEDVWGYFQKFAEWRPYKHKVLCFVDGKLVPLPVNIDTVNIIFGINIKTEDEMKRWLEKNTEKIAEPKNGEEAALARVGRVLYEKLFKNYTKKQWDRWPAELDASVLNRIPVRTNYEDGYFTDKYQARPLGGFTQLISKMLAHPNIKVELNTDYFFARDKFSGYKKLFFTGPIDKFFDYKFGKLPYRSLRFEFETLTRKFFQSNSVINYPNEQNFTRITEYKYFTENESDKTTISREYPTWEGEPTYPVIAEENNKIFNLYAEEAAKSAERGIYVAGRLGNYKYINMDQACKDSLVLFNKLNSGISL